MAVVNIALITDYDAGVHEGTEAVDARSVLEVFAQNAERIQKVVLDMIGRFPADLDALGARGGAGVHARRRPRYRRPRTSGCSRRGCRWRGDATERAAADRRRPRVDPGRAVAWWLESARRLDAAGYAGRLGWDHFISRGDQTVPVVEAWTILTAAAASTERIDHRDRSSLTS